ncbi:uncharacterized protein LOC129960331 [Argiope bruennichi]|uniref:uncharacterized protein LOC129960331 n=1 Tax=Argiope bruennichi TaxID=94029 RepID=UPI0024946CCD|nr:uncharacterized protein LOC129960331 [Argiope bruennichi]
MYRQILIESDQCDLLRILWKTNFDDEPTTYKLKTVTYGTSCAPFLVLRTLKQLAIDENSRFPLTSEILLHDTYMDDIVSGSSTLEGAKELQHQLIEVMQSVGLKLHKWHNNFENESRPSEDSYKFDKEEGTKALGVLWNSQEDCFALRVDVNPKQLYTKREVLSTIARIFGPLGLLNPVIAKAKMIMQELCRINIDWNDVQPESEYREWHRFLIALKALNEILINRRVVFDQPTSVELHGFADASERCYGAVMYCKSSDAQGNTMIKLVASKSRVAPIKSL